MKAWLLILSVLSGFANANEIRWLRLKVNLEYKDPTTVCTNFNNQHIPVEEGFFLIALELDQGRIVRAQLNNFPKRDPFSLAIYENLRFEEAELSAIELFKDANGKFWLKTLNLPPRIVQWVLSASTKLAILCKVPQRISLVEPGFNSYSFDTEGLGGEVLFSRSNWIELKGKRLDGKPFEAKLQVVEEEENPTNWL